MILGGRGLDQLLHDLPVGVGEGELDREIFGELIGKIIEDKAYRDLVSRAPYTTFSIDIAITSFIKF